jgi:hypothetical protein
MTCDNLCPVFSSPAIVSLEKQMGLAVTKPEFRLTPERFDRLA